MGPLAAPTPGSHTPPPAAATPPRAPRAPLLPVALAVTLGITVARFLEPPPGLWAAGAAAGLTAWLLARRRGIPHPVPLLWLTAGMLAGGWAAIRDWPAPDDVGRLATTDGVFCRLRGTLGDDLIHRQVEPSPLRSRQVAGRVSGTLNVTQVLMPQGWINASGRVHLSIPQPAEELLPGSLVEVVGELSLPPAPGNPGEYDLRRRFRDEGWSAGLRLKSADGILRVEPDRAWSPGLALGRWRQRAGRLLTAHLGEEEGGVARALLLGDQAAMQSRQVEGFRRTGVVHVLAVSGQHLAILCGALYAVLPVVGLSRRQSAVVVPILAVGYALLTGAQAPVVRAAVVVTALCLGAVLRRRIPPANALALAWLAVALIQPADLFQTGSLLSFLGVVVLTEVIRPWHAWVEANRDPVRQLVDVARPAWQRAGLFAGRWLAWSAATSAVCWLAALPLVAREYHVCSPAAVVLGPFIVLLMSVALVTGFVFFLAAAFAPPLAAVLARAIHACLWLSDGLVSAAEAVPGGYWYVAGVPLWFEWGWYLLFLGTVYTPWLRRRWALAVVAGLVWCCVGFVAAWPQGAEPGLRCTFLAVGHGGCAVLETPDGRTILYDVGSLAGPEVAARQVAPFLWSRGITRLDEVFISHADLDHFNGLPDLLERFHVGQVSLTPTFRNKRVPAVRLVDEELRRRGVPWRVVSAGDTLTTGPVRLHVLHPPAAGPPGSENARSLVLLVEYLGRTILLTGDLEEPGLGQVLRRRDVPVDVLLAPHHGSAASNTPELAAWAGAGLVVSSEGPPRGRRADPYTPAGGTLWRTWEEGAVTVEIDGRGLGAWTYRTGRRWAR